MRRTAFLASVAAAAFVGGGAGPASAATPIPGDEAILAGPFQLNLETLEPGAFPVGLTGEALIEGLGFGADQALSVANVDVTQKAAELQISVAPGASFSIDQVLVPGDKGGYRVVNTFDTGTSDRDADIDPGQTATDLVAPPGTALPDLTDLIPLFELPSANVPIVVVSDHPDADQNEPYEQAPGNEVAAVNRPVITPKLAALGVSALAPVKAYKAGFGYATDGWYDNTWRGLFATDTESLLGMDWWGDPQGLNLVPDADKLLDNVSILPNGKHSSVRRVNDVDEFGEGFSNPGNQADYNQTRLFNQAGDPHAFLHASMLSTVADILGGLPPEVVANVGVLGAIEDLLADETTLGAPWNLVTLTTQGDLPITWALKSSMAPQRYARSMTLTDDAVRAWEAAWQAYYVGKGPKPSLPLAPGTNSPAPNPGVIVNIPETLRVVGGIPVVQQQEVKPAAVSGKIARVKLLKRMKRGKITYLGANGVRTAKASRVGKRLVAFADLRGMPISRQQIWAVLVTGVTKKGKAVKYTELVDLV